MPTGSERRRCRQSLQRLKVPPVGTPDHELASEMELIARETSQRIGMVRALGLSRTQASTDPLTGLPNRRELEERLRALQAARVEIALAFADLDNFKSLHDRHGHATSDKALSLFAAACRVVLRKGDFRGPLRGRGVRDRAAGLRRGDRGGDRRPPAGGAGRCVRVAAFPRYTASFGLAVAERDESIDSVLGRADLALLRAKRDGRDRVVLASDIPAADTIAALIQLPTADRTFAADAPVTPTPTS